MIGGAFDLTIFFILFHFNLLKNKIVIHMVVKLDQFNSFIFFPVKKKNYVDIIKIQVMSNISLAEKQFKSESRLITRVRMT